MAGFLLRATGTVARPPAHRNEYASISNNGKKLVHDLTDTVTGTPQLLGVTDLTEGTTTSLGLVGDNAVWSPNGRYIAYHNFEDHIRSGGDPNVPVVLNIVPATGGTPVTVRAWGGNPSWSNNSRRLAFTDWFNGYVGTVGLDGSETKFDVDTLGSYEGYGCNPAYSPDGKTIVFSGIVGGDPTTAGLYTVSVYGGDPVVLFDRPGKGEWDPA